MAIQIIHCTVLLMIVDDSRKHVCVLYIMTDSFVTLLMPWADSHKIHILMPKNIINGSCLLKFHFVLKEKTDTHHVEQMSTYCHYYLKLRSKIINTKFKFKRYYMK